MSRIKVLALLFCMITLAKVSAQTSTNMNFQSNYPQALVDYDDFKNLVIEVEAHRARRLIDLETFLKMSKEANVVILDTRSDLRYQRVHIKGAIHLAFTDFTQENLQRLIPDPNTKILIYCNNNFDGDQIDFTSKVARPSPSLSGKISKKDKGTKILSNEKPVMLALNVPTYINLYGYGYRNVYELNELVNVNSPRIEFKGTKIK